MSQKFEYNLIAEILELDCAASNELEHAMKTKISFTRVAIYFSKYNVTAMRITIASHWVFYARTYMHFIKQIVIYKDHKYATHLTSQSETAYKTTSFKGGLLDKDLNELEYDSCYDKRRQLYWWYDLISRFKIPAHKNCELVFNLSLINTRFCRDIFSKVYHLSN